MLCLLQAKPGGLAWGRPRSVEQFPSPEPPPPPKLPPDDVGEHPSEWFALPAGVRKLMGAEDERGLAIIPRGDAGLMSRRVCEKLR